MKKTDITEIRRLIKDEIDCETENNKKSLSEKLDNFLKDKELDRISEREIFNLTNQFCINNSELVDTVELMTDQEINRFVQDNI